MTTHLFSCLENPTDRKQVGCHTFLQYSCLKNPTDRRAWGHRVRHNWAANTFTSLQAYSKMIQFYIYIYVMCLTLCNSMDYSLTGSSVHGILQARTILEWVAVLSSRGSSQPRDWTLVSHCRQILYCLSHHSIAESPCCMPETNKVLTIVDN